MLYRLTDKSQINSLAFRVSYKGCWGYFYPNIMVWLKKIDIKMIHAGINVKMKSHEEMFVKAISVNKFNFYHN